MSKICASCARLESLLAKRDKEIQSLKARLKNLPNQAISNLRAEVLELKDLAIKTHQRVCNLKWKS